MEREEPVSQRAARAVVLIALAVVALLVAGGVYLWPTLAHRGASGPPTSPAPVGTFSSMGWTSAGDGWLVVAQTGPLRSTLYRTGDAGHSWHAVRSAVGLLSASFWDTRHGVAGARSVDPLEGRVTWGPVFQTDDGGSHWSELARPELDSLADLPQFVDARHGWLLAGGPLLDADPSATPSARFDLYGTDDGGANWRQLLRTDPDHPLGRGVPTRLWVSFADALHGWLGAAQTDGSTSVYRSADGGQSWQATPLPPPPGGWPHGVALPVRVQVSTDGGGQLAVASLPAPATASSSAGWWVWSTSDAGVTWREPVAPPAASPSVLPSLTDGRTAWSGAAGQAWVSADSGRSWQPAGRLPAGWTFQDLAALDGSVAWALALRTPYLPLRLYTTVDGGRHWRQVTAPTGMGG
jgi:hypothetical protein